MTDKKPKKTPAKINMGQSHAAKKAVNLRVEAGKSAATKDLKYRYNLEIVEREMQEFLNEAKRHGTKGSILIRAYIDRQMASWGK